VNWRHFRNFLIRIVLPLSLTTSLAGVARATIRYSVSLDHPERHIFHVAMEIPEVSGEVAVQMAAWNALYQIRDFSAHVLDVQAFAGAEKIPLEKIDKQTWRIAGSGTITVKYATYWDEPGSFATQLNSEHAFINPAMILLYVPARRGEEVKVDLNDIPGGWAAAAGLPVLDESMGGAHMIEVSAPSYDTVADAPIEAGQFEEFDLNGMTPRVSIVVHGDKWKKKEVSDALRRICTYELKLMEGAPYEHYTFIFHIGKAAGRAGGGMEHANSTAISLRSGEDLLNISAHEFFHLWNVKRIRPATLEPVDYSKEQYTRALWFAEGVTSTYAGYTLVRTQLWSKEQFYFDLSQQISELESRPANRWQSAEESSLDAWLEKYSLYNRPQESVSYYAKGQVLGVLLDMLIRDRTNNEKSLDDVMRAMNAEFARQNKPYRDSLDVQAAAERVASGSFEEFFRKYVAHAEPLPYRQILGLAGLELRTTTRKRPVLGFYAERQPGGELAVQNVDPEGFAAEGDLRAGDVIMNWNGSDPPRNPERWLASQKPGTELRLTVQREDKHLTLEFRIGEAAETFYQVAEDRRASDRAQRIRDGLLRGTTQPVTAAVH
jgi:predicted metalloprotease with PDZ domain